VSARDDVLAAVRAALAAGRPSEPDAPYARGGDAGRASETPPASGRAHPDDGHADTAALSPPRHGTAHVPEGHDDAASAVLTTGDAGPSTVGDSAMLDRFVERVADYLAMVTRCAAADLQATVVRALDWSGSVVVPEGLGLDLPGAVIDDGLASAELDAIDAVVTTAAVGIAETGTVVLDHGRGQGRRVITLLPDLHVCVIREDQVVPDVPDAFARLDPQRPQTWISGPSATSDIELSRVEGVHGPRRLHVILVAE
jgi:L-lactate dehydrogenase complex protein LldG